MLVPTAFEARGLFGDALADRLAGQPLVPAQLAGVDVRVALCGFGLAAAGSGAACALAAWQESWREDEAQAPQRGIRHAYLIGIAGTYHPRRLRVGQALVATFARCVGIGAGAGPRHRSAGALGWAQGLSRPGLPDVADTVDLAVPAPAEPRGDGGIGGVADRTPGGGGPGEVMRGGLLSVAAASGSRYEARRRAKEFPDALAEEMEAFSVALACRLAARCQAGVPLTVVRGISNVAGDRDPAHWRSGTALAAARGVLAWIMYHTLEGTPSPAGRPASGGDPGLG